MSVPSPAPSEHPTATVVGRYVLHAPIARGGMATIHIARLMGAEGFSRVVAAKRLHPEFVADSEFLTMFLDEARIASKVQHPNVVHVIDVVANGNEVILVQEYIHGVPLNVLLRAAHHANQPVPMPVAVAIGVGIAAGVHGAHSATDELGQPLNIVHRDVSPQNVMVALDGTPRLLDFGVAKATLSAHVTRVGTFKGKIAYMAPEQLKGTVTQRTDIYSLGVLLWEAVVGRRLHQGQNETALMTSLLRGEIESVTQALQPLRPFITDERWAQLEAIEPIVTKAMALDPNDRFSNAAELGAALATVVRPATTAEVATWVKEMGKEYLDGRDKVLVQEEVSWRKLQSGPSPTPLSVAESSSSGIVPNSLHSRSGVSSVDGLVPASNQGATAQARSGGWIAAVIVLVALLSATVVALIMRRPEPPAPVVEVIREVPPPSAVVPTVVLPATATPVSVAAAPPPAPSSSAPTAVAATPTGAPAAPAWTWTPPRARPAPAAPRAAGAQAASPGAGQAAPAVNECDPPFYFEGKKKIYKPGCI